MIRNLYEYFDPRQQVYLESINYTKLDKDKGEKELLLNCQDTIEVLVYDEIVNVKVHRDLGFEFDQLFKLSISAGVILRFIPEKKSDYYWTEIDLSKEFKENGHFALSNIMNRISLVIAQITSSFGQSPIILPPGIASSEK